MHLPHGIAAHSSRGDIHSKDDENGSKKRHGGIRRLRAVRWFEEARQKSKAKEHPFLHPARSLLVQTFFVPANQRQSRRDAPVSGPFGHISTCKGPFREDSSWGWGLELVAPVLGFRGRAMAVNFGSKTQGALGFPYNTGPSLAAGSALPPLPGNTQHQHTPAAARCVLRTSGF